MYKIKKEDIIGVSKRMNNGLMAEVTDYVNCSNLTIQWETGEIQVIKSLAHFRDGKIALASETPEAKSEKRLGERKMMRCGLEAELVEYFAAHNITVQWDDGLRSTGKYYTDFENGSIAYPKEGRLLIEKHAAERESKIGTTIKMKNGINATCIDWTNDNSFYIEFENGIVIRVRKWQYFIDGDALPSDSVIEKMKMVITAKNGQKMWIKRYKPEDLTIEFEDGTLVEHQRFEKFKTGDVVNPNARIKAHTSINEFFIRKILEPYGFEKWPQGSLEHLGFGRMELDCFNEDLMIAIEYDGEVHSFRPNTDLKKNEACQKAGIALIRIREGKLGVLNDTSIDFVVKNQKPLNIELQNVLIKIIKRINKLSGINIDPEVALVEDYDKTYDEFNKIYRNPHIGEKRKSKDGEEAILTRYKDYKKVDIKFNDGYEKTLSYQDFKNENFYKIKPRVGLKVERYGEKRIMKDGKVAKIVRYGGYDDIDVLLECGYVVYNTTYQKFKNGLLISKCKTTENDAEIAC